MAIKLFKLTNINVLNWHKTKDIYTLIMRLEVLISIPNCCKFKCRSLLCRERPPILMRNLNRWLLFKVNTTFNFIRVLIKRSNGIKKIACSE